MQMHQPTARPQAFIAQAVTARPSLHCAQCGERLLAPEWSEYLDARRVRHLWACELCGYSFESLVVFPADEAA
jgi:hypothetical protein